MRASEELYDDLDSWLAQSYRWQDQRHLKVLLYMVRALLYSGSVNLSKWSSYLPGRCAQSQQRRLSRWLGNPRIVVHELYSGIIQAALSDWQQHEMFLALDTSMLWNEFCLVRLVVVHRGRGLPVSWCVLRHRSSSVAYSAYQSVIQRAAAVVPDGVSVIVLADRGFVHTDLMAALSQMGWHYRIRLKSECWVKRGARPWRQLNSYHLSAGEAILFWYVKLHKEKPFSSVYIVLARTTTDEIWAVVSDQPVSLNTLKEYALRFSIEETFLDDKSNGFELERSRIRSAQKLERLCFVLAIATLYLTAHGVAVVESGQRRTVDVHWFRGNSYFRIGWDWLRRALCLGQWRPFAIAVRFGTTLETEPVLPSLKYVYKQFSLDFSLVELPTRRNKGDPR